MQASPNDPPSPTGFDPRAVEDGLVGTRFAGLVRHLETTGSTNQVALEAALTGRRSGIWVADEQTAGRGRGGHRWHSAAGDGLYVSVLLTPGVPLSQAAMIPLATGLAVQAAIAAVTGLAVDLRWPNDLLIGTRKLGGILVESASERGAEAESRLRYAVVGIGLNLNQAAFPEELSALATSLFLQSGRRYAREQLLVAILPRLDQEIRALEARTPGLLERFAAASTWVSGKHVRVEEQGGYTGWTCGLDARGFLKVTDTGGSVRTVLSGGVRPY